MFSWAQKSPIEIVSAASAEIQTNKGNEMTKLIGNVALKQASTIMYCDSALFFERENRVEAFSNVKLIHQDTITILGNYLNYDGNSKKAFVNENVKLSDKTMLLETEKLDFDLYTQIGHYQNGGRITSGQTILKSEIGDYHSNENEFYFQKNVKVTHPEYNVVSDTMMYHTRKKIVYFFGPTVISSQTEKIKCSNGWYNTLTDQSQFSKNTSLFSEGKILQADSLFYNRKKQFGSAFRNVSLYDSAQQTTLYGNYGQVNGITKKAHVTANALAVKIQMKKDTIFLSADTLFLNQETPKQVGAVLAYKNVRVFKQNLQAISDSAVYLNADSSLWMYGNPIAWTGKSQMNADTIHFLFKSNRIDSVLFLGNAFFANQEKTIHFNQLKGKNCYAKFDTVNIQSLNVNGNAQSIYYSKEDSINYIGVNIINSGEMTFYFEKGELKRVVALYNPEGKIYPLDELKPQELKLKGFKWTANKRPQKPVIQR
jgi:lipopolysaccharide export system protein LptA